MIEEARDLYNQGYSLIPLIGKKPIKGFFWENFQRERASSSQIEEWFKEPFNIGVICGKISGIVVLDIDPRNGGVVSDWLNKFPTDRYVLTGNGGAHLYYRHPGGVVENVHPAPGVDVKGDGGYVVAPPSIHPDTKRTYVWVSRGEPAPFPSEILTPVHEKEQKTSNSWISSLLEFGARDGEKNDSLASLSGYFASKEVPKDVALSIVKLWNQRNSTKLDAKEIETSVNSVYKTASRRKLSPVIEPSEHTDDLSYVGDKRFKLQEFDEFMRTYADTPIDWIVPGWMPDKTIGFLISPPGTFKTWLLLDLAVSTAIGGKFLGIYPVKLTGPVFLIQQEDWAGQTAQRIEVIRQSKVVEMISTSTDESMTLDLPKNIPLYIHTDRQLKFDDKSAMEGLVKSIEEIRPKLVILDPLYSAANTDDYMAKSTQQMFLLKELRDKFGCTFVIAHHTNKGANEDRQRAWGSQFLNAFLETGWQVFPKGKTSIKVKRHFKAAGNPEETCLSFKINTETGFTYSVAEGLVDAKNGDSSEIEEGELIQPEPPEPKEDKGFIGQESDANPFLKEKQPGCTQKQIMEFLSQKVDYLSAKEISDALGDENVNMVTKKLDTLLEKNLVRRKVDLKKRPGWKKSYKIQF